MHHRGKRITAVAGLALAAVLMAAPAAHAHDDRYDRRTERRSNFNDEYIFSTTRMVSELEAPAAVKVPLFPPAVVIDLVFLPAEVIAGFF